jgi:predicted transcriptional regulator
MSEEQTTYLREWRQFNNVTQTELAKKIGVTRARSPGLRAARARRR